ncbi:MAG TPA: ATPase, T2SS/T4P/T4SS family [Phycisphaerales bacterium]|nr:ATPase, T2SS/T4P/T4SS family [Phycisphaerales bacterium]
MSVSTWVDGGNPAFARIYAMFAEESGEFLSRRGGENSYNPSVEIPQLLIQAGVITPEQARQAEEEQARTGERVDRVLVRMGLANSAAVLGAIAEQFAMPIVDLNSMEVAEDVLKALPPKFVFKKRCVPIARNNGTLRIATADPFELTSFDELRLVTGLSIELVLADERDVSKFIRTHYGVAGDTLEALAEGSTPQTVEVTSSTDADEVEQAQEASVIRLVNDLMLEAIKERATDVHIEPYEDRLIIRYRIDGLLTHAGVPATVNRFRNAIISRLKIMANLNIAEKRKPQDGRISLRAKGQEFDLRVSVIPMLFGEGVVLRILNKSTIMYKLEDLGMDGTLLEQWDQLIDRPHGIILVTGPTGSGKSTTLYASLQRVVNEEVKAITIEDPVEYHVDGVNQIQTQAEVGLTFAAGLRAVLRHDPDIIMIGEIRDLETAEAAVQASLTGHLVFSTLHTNDSAGAATRLLDMGVEPFLVASSLEGVLAQRLVRRICPECRASYQPDPADFPPDYEVVKSVEYFKGSGCRECRQTGYRGRVGIYELLTITEPIREMIIAREAASRISQAAIDSCGMMLLRQAGFEKVRQGQTTLAEVVRATRL